MNADEFDPKFAGLAAVRVGALCAGYGGIEQGLASVEPVTLAWFAEYDDAPAAIMAHHHPGVTNHRDVTTIRWDDLEPVDVLTAGYPCQPFSHAGKRQGEDDPRHLWPHIARGIATLRPRLCVFENVRGHLSLGFDTVLLDLHRLGYDVRYYLLRAADVGAPHGRARLFIFATDRATVPADDDPWATPVAVAGEDGWLEPESHLFGQPPFAGKLPACGVMVGGRLYAQPAWLSRPDLARLLPTPTARDHKDHMIRREPHRPDSTDTLSRALADVPAASGVERGGDLVKDHVAGRVLPVVNGHQGGEVGEGFGAEGDGFHDPTVAPNLPAHLTSSASRFGNDLTLLPTPAVNDMGEGKDVDAWDAWTERMRAAHGNGNGHGKSLAIEAQRLLPTPRASEPTRSTDDHAPTLGQVATQTPHLETDRPGKRALPPWGDYAPAIARWEAVLGRPAPAPTEPNAKGGHRLSPRFVEWMQGLPEGHVCDVPGLTRNNQLKALGNGVVPQQAAAAYRAFLTDTKKEAAA